MTKMLGHSPTSNSMAEFTDKSVLRQYAKALRSDLPIEIYSRTICDKLKNSTFYKEAKNILIYSSFSSEISTKLILQDKEKCFYLPKVNGKELDICPFSEKNSLNKFGIEEPDTEPIRDLSIIELAIIPALCADKNGYRLGYGKGYYDRLLPKLNTNCKKVIIIPSELFFDEIPHDNFDIRCNVIITQRNIIFI